MTIGSNEQFPIVRQLDDPLDVATYYVQAKVYKGSDNSLLATVNLANLGSQNFAKLWQAPADTSGMGTWIYVITKVFTDSAYTSISSKYGIVSTVYLIQDRINRGNLGGGGYSNIDYPRLWKNISTELEPLVRKIVDETVGGYISKIEPVNYAKIHSSMKGITKELGKDLTNYSTIDGLLKKHVETIPKPEKIEIPKPVSKEELQDIIITNIAEQISKIEPTELKGTMGRLYDHVDSKMETIKEELSKSITKESSETRNWLKNHMTKYMDYMEKMSEENIKMRNTNERESL